MILLQLYDGDVIQPMNGLGFSTYPCIYRQHIYFLSTPQVREEFSKNPMLYLTQNISRPVVPIRLSIIGPPKSGKTACKYLISSAGKLRQHCMCVYLYQPLGVIQEYRRTAKNPSSSLALEP